MREKTADPSNDVQNPLPWSRLQTQAEEVRGGVVSFAMAKAQQPMFAGWEASDIKRHCQIIQKLGDGTYGRVYAGKYKGECKQVAVKISTSDRLHHSIQSTEIALLDRAQGHPNVIYMRDYFYTPYFVVIVMDMHDMDLHVVLQRWCRTGGLQPDVALQVLKLIVLALKWLHDHNILHRDLHAGNVLMSLDTTMFIPGLDLNMDHITHVCVSDLGCGCDIHGDKPNIKRSGHLGAAHIRAPEVWFADGNSARYDTSLDVWAVGVLSVQMTMGSAFFPRMTSTTDVLRFWQPIIGGLTEAAAKKYGWQYQPGNFGKTHREYADGLQPVAPTRSHDKVTIHLTILKWNPQYRPNTTKILSVIECPKKVDGSRMQRLMDQGQLQLQGLDCEI